jgi:hypothetical protein
MSKLKTPSSKVKRSRPVKVARQKRGSYSLKDLTVQLSGLKSLNCLSSFDKRLCSRSIFGFDTSVSPDLLWAMPKASLVSSIILFN